MNRWALIRTLIIALSFLSVSVALATIPGRAVGYWYLYFSPVAIAALSFGLFGALAASAIAWLGVFAFALRIDLVARDTGIVLAQHLGDPEGPLLREFQATLSEVASRASFVVVDGGLLKVGLIRDMLTEAVLGVVLITFISGMVGWLVDENRRKSLLNERLARTDELTGLANYRQLIQQVNDEIARSKRYGHQFAFLMVDVDTLKYANDTYGHLVGNVVLREVGRLLHEHVRNVDTVARYGGDEFGVVLAETGASGAALAAERLRQAVAEHVIAVRGLELAVTVSIGVAVYPGDGEDEMRLVEAADNALYEAKLIGRNTIAVAAGPEEKAEF